MHSRFIIKLGIKNLNSVVFPTLRTPNILILKNNNLVENKWFSHVSPKDYYECPLASRNLR